MPRSLKQILTGVMKRLRVDDLQTYDTSIVSALSREDAIDLALRALDLARRLANQLDGDCGATIKVRIPRQSG